MDRNPRLVLGSFLARAEAVGAAQAAEVTRVFRVPSQSGVASANFGQQELGIVHSSAFLLVVGVDDSPECIEVVLNRST
jgi:hypothetical protein